jgi:hypothetical protein
MHPRWSILHQYYQVVLNYVASKEMMNPLAAKAGDLNLQTQMGSTKVSGETQGLLVGFMFGSVSTLWSSLIRFSFLLARLHLLWSTKVS